MDTKQYVYEGKSGYVTIDGFEFPISELSDSERITAGEQLLKRLSIEQGRPVSEMREELSQLAAKALSGSMSQTIGEPNTDDRKGPMNRKQRRAAKVMNRKARHLVK